MMQIVYCRLLDVNTFFYFQVEYNKNQCKFTYQSHPHFQKPLMLYLLTLLLKKKGICEKLETWSNLN